MATTVKERKPFVVITVDGQWRCENCGTVTDATPVCAGAHDDGSPRCGRAICERCAGHCLRCKAPLCPDDLARSMEGMLCVQCAPPPGGRAAYVARQQARAASAAAGTGEGPGYDWRTDSDRAYQAAADAQQSVDEANRRVEEIERQIAEMKARMGRRNAP